MSTATLLYGDSTNADVLYFSKVFVPDAFVSIGLGRKKVGVLNALEFGRIQKTGAFDELLPQEEWGKGGLVSMIKDIANAYGIEGFRVARDFPLGLAMDLKQARVKLEVVDGELFAKREVKTEFEAKAIQQGNAASTAGIKAAEAVLRAATIKGNKLIYKGKALTSEFVRAEVEKACLERGAIPDSTIVAGGNQACDPHERGSGLLRPHELIIVDVFPKITKTGYNGDMTRTFLKGRASDAQKGLVKAVREAQKAGLAKLKAGVTGKAVHAAVQEVFDSKGFKTQKTAKGYAGFFHGTGHGLGLEVHEAPRVNPNGGKLKNGAVVTIEPGLYYPGLGGCRIEDVAWIQKDGYKLLSKCHYTWHLK